MSDSENELNGAVSNEAGLNIAAGLSETALSAKQERTTAKRLLTMSITAMDKAIAKEQAISIVEKLFVNVDHRWEAAQDKHAAYLSHIQPEDADLPAVEIQWLLGCSDAYADAGTSKKHYVNKNSAKAPAINEGVKQAKRGVKFERATLHSRIESLYTVASDETVTTKMVEETQYEMKKQLEKYLTVQRDLIIQLSDDDEVDTEMAISERMQKICLQANVSAGKRIKAKDQAMIQEGQRNRSGLELKLERMKLPSFSGDLREYPRFKYEFDKFVKPSVKDDDEAIYVLKSCLSKEALAHVKNVDDNLDEMWKRLEDRYGRTSLITRAILADIKQLTRYHMEMETSLLS